MPTSCPAHQQRSQLAGRLAFSISAQEIQEHNAPEDATPVPGSRSYHSWHYWQDGKCFHGYLSCCCSNCIIEGPDAPEGICVNGAYVEALVIFEPAPSVAAAVEATAADADDADPSPEDEELQLPAPGDEVVLERGDWVALEPAGPGRPLFNLMRLDGAVRVGVDDRGPPGCPNLPATVDGAAPHAGDLLLQGSQLHVPASRDALGEKDVTVSVASGVLPRATWVAGRRVLMVVGVTEDRAAAAPTPAAPAAPVRRSSRRSVAVAARAQRDAAPVAAGALTVRLAAEWVQRIVEEMEARLQSRRGIPLLLLSFAWGGTGRPGK